MKEGSPHLSVIIPVYSCKECLFELHRRLRSSLKEITDDFEIILINDGSPDNSWEVITELTKKDGKVTGINLSRNFGQHCAITAGLDYARGSWIVVMDCDLQDQPEEIINLYNKAEEGYDIVLGRRMDRQDGFIKKITSNLFYALLSYLTETKQDASIANFGIYSKKVIEVLKTMREHLRYFPVMIRWVGFNSTSIDIIHKNREFGKTSYNFKKLFNLAFNVMISFSDKPLRLMIKLGIILSSLSFLYATYIVVRALFGIKGVVGWPSLIASIWFLSGLIISILGVVGVYVGKTFEEVKKRPVYIIKETIND